MSFVVHGLDPTPFAPLFGLDTDALAAHGAERHVADALGGVPDRIELRDLRPGESALLLNHTHQPADNPYRASHAIFVREGATTAAAYRDTVPPALAARTLSVRAFSDDHRIVDADLVDGPELPALVTRLFAQPGVAYLHAHYARYGCFAARIERA